MSDIFIGFRWLDLLDILLVSFVIYKLIQLLKGTRALQMLIGLAILMFTLVISKWSGLYTVDWLVTSFWTQIVIALIILFQPEMRKALARIGQTPFAARMSELEEQKTIEDIIKACVSLSNKRIGAIIVMERKNELKEIVEMGIQMDAKVSKEIITSTFLPYSPIHDGAIVVSGSRILAAGCFLPLTINQNVNKVLGTRHRAALGVTEESDAVVIVISEETGAITVTMGGKMTRELDASSLRKVLTRTFVKKKEKEKYTIMKKIKNMLPQTAR